MVAMWTQGCALGCRSAPRWGLGGGDGGDVDPGLRPGLSQRAPLGLK